MKRLIIAAGLLLGLGGCATYDYVGGGAGGYYHGSPSTQYSYPYGYPYGGRYGGYYGFDSGYYGYGSYPLYRPPVYRPPHNHRPPSRPPQHGHGNGHRPGHGGDHNHRPGHGGDHGQRPRPPQGHRPPVNGGGSKAPWRDMDRVQSPQTRPTPTRPVQQARPAVVAPRQPVQSRPAAPARQPSQNRQSRPLSVQER